MIVERMLRGARWRERTAIKTPVVLVVEWDAYVEVGLLFRYWKSHSQITWN